MGNFIDETGNVYGKLTVIRMGEMERHGAKWVCECECGNLIETFGWHLRGGKATTCGHCGWNTEEERFWMKVDVGEEDECWEWNSYRVPYGYGSFSIDNIPVFAHRYSYEYYYGKIPEGMVICHHCDNPPCVNPKHLFLGTHADNVEDKIQKGRMPTGEDASWSKLTWDDIKEIRTLYATGNYLQKEIGNMFDITGSHVGSIVNNKSWVE